MYLIENNPYRILGLLAGAGAREINRQTSRLHKIIAADLEPPTDDFSFPVLGKITRTTESIEESISKLNLDIDKMNAALFWFWNGNSITDEVAFDALKEGNEEEAYQIWDKLIIETQEDGKRYWREVSEKNCSAFHNCFVLEMLHEYGNKHTAIVANLNFLESEFCQKFILTIVDNTHRTNSEELQLNFLNEILLELEKDSINLTFSKFVSILKDMDFCAKEAFLKNISRKFSSNISALIETAKKKRTNFITEAAKTGEELYLQTKNDLELLESVVGMQDFAYSNMADKVANEILLCGADYFSHYRETDCDPSTDSMDLFEKANLVAVGSAQKQRINESIKNIQEWEKQQKVKTDCDLIEMKLQNFQTLADSIANAKDLVDSCIPNLNNIKNILGSNDDFYIKISSAVAVNAMGMLVSFVNDAQNSYKVKVGNFTTFRPIIRSALELSVLIGTLRMTMPQRSNYNSNHSTLNTIASQLGVSLYLKEEKKNWFTKNMGCLLLLINAVIIIIILKLLSD